MTLLTLSTKTRKDKAYVVYTTPDGASVYFPASSIVEVKPTCEVNLNFGPVVRKAPKFLTDAEKLAEALAVVARLSPKTEKPTVKK